MSSFFKALGISFSGSLPVGIMNMAALQVSVTQGVSEAMAFAVTAIGVEGLYMVGTGWSAERLQANPRWVRWLNRVSAVLLLAIGVLFFIRALSPAQAVASNAAEMPGWQYGLWLRLLNPTAILFWLGVHLALGNGEANSAEWEVREPQSADQRAWKRLLIFAVGAMIGTFGAYCVYILAANQMQHLLKPWSAVINAVLGLLCIGAAVWKWRE